MFEAEGRGPTHLKVNKSYSDVGADILHPRCLLLYYKSNDWRVEKIASRLHQFCFFMTADLRNAVKNVQFFTVLYNDVVIVSEREA